ncbi:hypothetical protein [Lactococcus lactis]|uniref:hypothetical protein n=1 Tax=Lactococcus lactis TaxID=1358 RepID=UPI0024A8F693|nr:hypothetical protein [Lactococcus lactis]
MTEIEKVTDNQAKARSIYNSLIKDNIFYTGISKNIAIALIELGIDSSTTDKLSVEKLQERCDRYEKVLEDIRTNTPIQELLNLPYGCACHEIASDALAAIGGDDE